MVPFLSDFHILENYNLKKNSSFIFVMFVVVGVMGGGG